MPRLQTARRSTAPQDISQQDPIRLAALCRAWLSCHSDLIVILAPNGRVAHVAQASAILDPAACRRLTGMTWRSLWPADHRHALGMVGDRPVGQAQFLHVFGNFIKPVMAVTPR